MKSSPQLRTVEVPTFRDLNGTLRVYQGSSIGFAAVRTFLVHGVRDGLRGGHAHKGCSQLLVAVNGRVTVTFESETGSGTLTLESPDQSVLLPPMTWATQFFHGPESILMVICDLDYDESDYVRDHEEFLRLLGAAARGS